MATGCQERAPLRQSPRRRTAGSGLSLVLLLLTVITLGSASGAVAVLPDTPEASWSVNGRVWAARIVGQTIYVGGTFTTATSSTGQTAPRANLAAFDMSTGALRTDWRADTGAPVRALDTHGSWLVVGGTFGRIGGVVRERLARVSLTDGSVDPTFAPTFNGNIRAIDVDADAVYVGGLFTTANGIARQRIAKLRLQDGSVDLQFEASVNDTVLGLAKNPSSADLYVSGSFSAINGTGRQGVGAVSSVTGATRQIVFGSAARPTLGLATNGDGTSLFGAGGAGGNALAAWNTTTGVRVWRQVAMGDIQAVVHHRDAVYFGFHDGYQDDTRLKVLAADATTGLLHAGFRPRFDGFWGVYAVDASDLGVVVGGDFTTVSGVQAQGWARFLTQGDLPPVPVTTRYLGATSSWRYWDVGTRPAGWHLPTFPDQLWPSGAPQFGYGDGDETTVVSYGPNPSQKNIATYFRANFEVPSIPDLVTANLIADDGAVIYINGVEVARDNMPDGVIVNGTRALSNRSGGDESAPRPFNVPVQYLQPGTNSIAVEVHQVNSGSSDLSFDLDLIGETFPTPDPPGPENPVETEVVGEPASWEWRYMGPAPPVDWAEPSYAPVGWGLGNAPLGWGTAGPIATVIDSFPNTQDRPRAAYFRRAFDVPAGRIPMALRLSTVADDGVVVYVNGTEVARNNMPNGAVTHMTYAASARSTALANATPITIEVPADLLVEGTNVIAAETHVNYRATPNLSFKLSAVLTTVNE